MRPIHKRVFLFFVIVILAILFIRSCVHFGPIEKNEIPDFKEKTKGWVKYQNDAFNFTLSYPPKAKIIHVDDNVLSLLYFSDYPPEGDILIRVLSNPKRYSLRDFYTHSKESSILQSNGYNHIVRDALYADDISYISIRDREWQSMVQEIHEVFFATYSTLIGNGDYILEITDSGDHKEAEDLFHTMAFTFN